MSLSNTHSKTKLLRTFGIKNIDNLNITSDVIKQTYDDILKTHDEKAKNADSSKSFDVLKDFDEVMQLRRDSQTLLEYIKEKSKYLKYLEIDENEHITEELITTHYNELVQQYHSNAALTNKLNQINAAYEFLLEKHHPPYSKAIPVKPTRVSPRKTSSATRKSSSSRSSGPGVGPGPLSTTSSKPKSQSRFTKAKNRVFLFGKNVANTFKNLKNNGMNTMKNRFTRNNNKNNNINKQDTPLEVMGPKELSPEQMSILKMAVQEPEVIERTTPEWARSPLHLDKQEPKAKYIPKPQPKAQTRIHTNTNTNNVTNKKRNRWFRSFRFFRKKPKDKKQITRTKRNMGWLFEKPEKGIDPPANKNKEGMNAKELANYYVRNALDRNFNFRQYE